ncbi:DNA modification methylase [Paenibacillus sp. RC73]|uniref:DNA-methyltransferase n=1 Tax=Paenibacillus sp. RC73 TaxID=3156250 RepID=UPI0038399A52
MEVNGKVIQGDCLEVLREMPSNSVDSVVADPPYGLSKEPNITEVLTKWIAGEPYDHGHGGFMGKSWDSFVPHPDVWKEVYRVLKPGGHALVFAGTRTQDLMTIALRLGGFEIRDVIEWLYFSGFPKSMDVGKAFDRRRKEDSEAIRSVAVYLREKLEASGKTRTAIDDHFGTSNVSQYWFSPHRNTQVPPWDKYMFLKEFLFLSDKMDAEVWRLNGRKGKPGDAWENAEIVGEYAGTPGGFGDHRFSFNDKLIRSRTTDLARKWDGWGTALKPAHEPIIVARKPLAGTVAETVEKFGTGVINIDGCRIGRVEGDRTEYGVSGDEPSDVTAGIYGKFAERLAYTTHDSGRFPANCVTTGDDAFYSPYFNVAPQSVSKKASKRDRGVGNTHPTVKPTDLMAWLVRLVTPPGGTVLDPFAGSGSTLVSAKREGFGFIGVEREPEYVEIIRSRVEASEEEAA